MNGIDGASEVLRDGKRCLVDDCWPTMAGSVVLSSPTLANGVSSSEPSTGEVQQPPPVTSKRKRPDSDTGVLPSRTGTGGAVMGGQRCSVSAPAGLAVPGPSVPGLSRDNTGTSLTVSGHCDSYSAPSHITVPAKNTSAVSSDSDNYSDLAELVHDSSDPDSDFDYGDQQRKGTNDAEVDDCGSECEDDRSVVSGVTVASTGSLTPSLVGETLGFISLVETATPGQHTSPHPSAHSPMPLPVTSRAFTPSLFPHVPCAINFGSFTDKCDEMPEAVKKLMRWRLSTVTPQLVRQTLNNSNFRLLKTTPNWLGAWDKHMRSECFKCVRDFQKTNHFPGTFQIGRKDKLWRNIHALQLKFGKQEFGFVPRTYVLPADTKALRAAWWKEGSKRKWIVKPPASARGTGIRVVQHWSELPKKKQIVVQRYVSRPLLIDERKFDLRLYVYVSSFDPLRVYIYEDGLVRFASVKYSNTSSSLHDNYMHLTNYSVNKHCADYLPDGHKWPLRRFWPYLRRRGVDTNALWRRIVDLVLKTLVAGERHIVALQQQHVVSHYACHELLGFDVLLDERLRPWLLEVNINPSLHSAAPVDVNVKAPMLRDLLNIASYHLPNRLSEATLQNLADFVKQSASSDPPISQSDAGNAITDQSEALSTSSDLLISQSDAGNAIIDQSKPLSTSNGQWCEETASEDVQLPSSDSLRLVLDKRLYTSVLSTQERLKHAKFANTERSQYLDAILEELTPDDVRHLVRAEDEYSRRGGFLRVFPTAATHQYLHFMEAVRYHNKLMDAWEQRQLGDRQPGIQLLQKLCQRRTHLVVPKNYLRRKEFTPEVVAHAEELRKAHLTAASFAAKKGQKAGTECAIVTDQRSSRTNSFDSGVDGGNPLTSAPTVPAPTLSHPSSATLTLS